MIESQNRQDKITNPQKNSEDINQEMNLRPEFFSDFVGQDQLIQNLNVKQN